MERLAQLEADLAQLTDIVARISGTRGHGGGAERPSIWVWDQLTAERSRSQWAGLVPWVRWLIMRYPRALREFPPCWHLHPDAIEELTALWAAWRAAYHHGDDPSDDMVNWHDRWLPGVAGRLLGTGGVLTGCAAASTHRDVNLDGAPRNSFDDDDLPTVEEIAAGGGNVADYQ
jgi:hypothetical protein